jgi:hypothetical protein
MGGRLRQRRARDGVERWLVYVCGVRARVCGCRGRGAGGPRVCRAMGPGGTAEVQGGEAAGSCVVLCTEALMDTHTRAGHASRSRRGAGGKAEPAQAPDAPAGGGEESGQEEGKEEVKEADAAAPQEQKMVVARPVEGAVRAPGFVGPRARRPQCRICPTTSAASPWAPARPEGHGTAADAIQRNCPRCAPSPRAGPDPVLVVTNTAARMITAITRDGLLDRIKVAGVL